VERAFELRTGLHPDELEPAVLCVSGVRGDIAGGARGG